MTVEATQNIEAVTVEYIQKAFIAGQDPIAHLIDMHADYMQACHILSHWIVRTGISTTAATFHGERCSHPNPCNPSHICEQSPVEKQMILSNVMQAWATLASLVEPSDCNCFDGVEIPDYDSAEINTEPETENGASEEGG